MSHRNAHGQPPRHFYQHRADDRLVAEMLGIVKGVLADGIVNDSEAVALMQWIHSHPDVAVHFPGNLLSDRLVRIFDDGIIEPEERADLTEILRQLVGEPEDQSSQLDRSTQLPYDAPPPTLLFDGWEYVFTGRFAYGTRARCERAVTERGGSTGSAITRRTNVLVVGTFGSEAWVQSAWGTKILAAMDAKAAGQPVRIVGEEHWHASLLSC